MMRTDDEKKSSQVARATAPKKGRPAPLLNVGLGFDDDTENQKERNTFPKTPRSKLEIERTLSMMPKNQIRSPPRRRRAATKARRGPTIQSHDEGPLQRPDRRCRHA